MLPIPRRALALPVLATAGALVAALAAPATATAAAAAAPASSRSLDPNTQFYTPRPSGGATHQILRLLQHGHTDDATLLADMVATPTAKWFTGGSPNHVRADVANTVNHASSHNRVAVLVAYNLPYRDCAQYSAGGAADEAAYKRWINGFARGIGAAKAVVILEPDSLGIIPWNTDLAGNPEWCKPTDSNGNPAPQADPAHRYAELNYAVDRLERQPNVSVYLDGTHSAWLGVGDIAHRLSLAGVDRAQGFFVNVSNYQPTPQLQKYGTWISECLAFASNPDDGGWRLGHYDYCASQYYPADPNDFSTWWKTDQWYADNLGNATPTAHFVVDTSRNGTGPNDMSAYGNAPYDQPAGVVATLKAGNWCNPPGAGLGLRPTADTGVPLLDAYLWIKVPGESDGSCDIAGGARAWDYSAYTQPGWPTDPSVQQHFDPLWGVTDPRAGGWFPMQALQLARLAVPPLG